MTNKEKEGVRWKTEETRRKTVEQVGSPYAQNLILVNLILVNFFGFLVINRYRGGEFT